MSIIYFTEPLFVFIIAVYIGAKQNKDFYRAMNLNTTNLKYAFTWSFDNKNTFLNKEFIISH